MIRRLMASTAMLALLTAGGFGVAQAQTEPAEQPPAAQQDATGTDQGAAQSGDAAATTEEPAPPPEAADAATAEEPADATATADAPADEPADASATADAAAEEPADATATADASAEDTLQPEEPTIASAFMGQSVFSSEDPESDNIGDVKDLIIGNDGMITHAVVGVGGFLGIGEKEVAVPFDELQVVEDENGEIRLIYAATREQLEAAEEFDRTAYDPERRAAEEQQAAAQSGAATDPAAGLGAPAGGIAPAPAGDIAAAPEPMDEPAEGEAEEPTDLTAAEPAEGEMETETAEADAAATDVETETDAAATDMEATAETETDAAAGTEMTAETETDAAAAPEGEATAEVETDAAATGTEATTAETDAAATEETTTAQVETDAAATETQTADAGAEFDAESGFVSFSADQVRASSLMGQEIFGADSDESIGEVSDLVVQEDGETRAALVDVGGFLGVGEKEVAIPFDQIEVQAAEGEEPRLSIAMSREELEQLPAWEDPAEMAAAEPAATADAGAATTEEVQPDVAATDQPADAGAEGATTVANANLSAENLIGTAIVSPEEETVGEVGDVIFDQGGAIQAVVVDVGGFLGVGEKSVAIQFDALNVQKDTNGDLRLMVNATQEQLESAPAYEVEEQTAQ